MPRTPLQNAVGIEDQDIWGPSFNPKTSKLDIPKQKSSGMALVRSRRICHTKSHDFAGALGGEDISVLHATSH